MIHIRLDTHINKGALVGLALLAGSLMIAGTAHAQLSPIEELGKSIFFDQDLSMNQNQACAACHDPAWGFTGPIEAINEAGSVYEGSIPGRFGNRKPPSAAYAAESPILHFIDEKENNRNETEILFIGGNFWDGRATGEKLGNPAADQAQGPFLNPAEQALPDPACVVYRVCNAGYPTTFEDVFGAGACDIAWPADVETACATGGAMVSLSVADRGDVETAYDWIGIAIADYEQSEEVNPYSSKYDAYLRGDVRLSKLERKGLALFKGKGHCKNCHVLDEGPAGGPPLLTDNTFDNLGVPRNPDNPFYDNPGNAAGDDWVDPGLGGFLASRADYEDFAEDNYGKQRVPTLRNVAARPSAGAVKSFTHNGYFKSLKSVVHFYNTRDVKPACPDRFTSEADALAMGCWPVPEVEENVNTDELGNLHMSGAQEDAIVAFLRTLTDGYTQ